MDLMLIKSKSRGFSTVDETSRWRKRLVEMVVVEPLVRELPGNWQVASGNIT